MNKTNKGLSSQSYGFSSSHVWMWELHHKEGWAPKNWCFYIVVLEKALESLLDSKEIKSANPKGNQCWIFTGKPGAEAEASILWPPDAKSQLIGKDPDTGKDRRLEEKVMPEDKMVGWHCWFSGHEFEQALGDGEGQWSLECYSPWGCRVDMIDQLNNNNLNWWVQNFTLQEEKPDVLSTEELSIGMINWGKLCNLYICMHVCICDAGKDWKQEEKGEAEDEMVG